MTLFDWLSGICQREKMPSSQVLSWSCRRGWSASLSRGGGLIQQRCPLFTIAKMWKPTCPLTDEWIKKMWYIYTMEYYSAIKKNEILSFAAAWVDLEIIILSKVSQTKTNIIWYHLYVESEKNDTNELIYETETDPQTQRTDLWLPRGG